MWHCVTVKDATHWNLLNLKSYIMNHVFYRSHTGYTMKGSMLSCCTTIPWCTMQGGFHLAGFLPSSLAMGKQVLHHEIISIAPVGVRCVRQRSSGSVGLPRQLAQESEVVRQFLQPGKLLGGSIQIIEKLPNQNPDFSILTHHVLPLFFSILFGIWLASNWFVHGRKLPRPCLKSCIGSWNLRARRAIDS